MRVGGPNGIEIDDGGVRAGGLAVRSSGRALPSAPVAPSQASPLVPFAMPAHGVTIARIAAQAGAGVMALGSFAVVGLVFALGAPLGLLALPATGVVGALALGVFGRRLARRVSAANAEQTLLEAASRSGGSLTVAQAALALGTPLASADATLTALAHAGHVAVDLDESTGALRYRFHGLEQGRQLPARAASRLNTGGGHHE